MFFFSKTVLHLGVGSQVRCSLLFFFFAHMVSLILSSKIALPLNFKSIFISFFAKFIKLAQVFLLRF
jgi:hypothetical protein